MHTFENDKDLAVFAKNNGKPNSLATTPLTNFAGAAIDHEIKFSPKMLSLMSKLLHNLTTFHGPDAYRNVLENLDCQGIKQYLGYKEMNERRQQNVEIVYNLIHKKMLFTIKEDK